MGAAKRPLIPRRFTKALEEIRSNNKIVVITADKGGGGVVRNTDDYIEKMEDLLTDNNAYTKPFLGQAEREAKLFIEGTRCILRKTEKGKKLLPLVKEAPRTPTMRSLLRIHKPGVPIRPITSRIGSTPHRLKTLAAPFSTAPGKMSNSLKKTHQICRGNYKR